MFGTAALVTATKEKLGVKAKGRDVVGGDGSFALRESRAPYGGTLGHGNDVLRFENAHVWDDTY